MTVAKKTTDIQTGTAAKNEQGQDFFFPRGGKDGQPVTIRAKSLDEAREKLEAIKKEDK